MLCDNGLLRKSDDVYTVLKLTNRSLAVLKGEEKVLVPGDPEREFEKERLKNGIPLLDTVVKDLEELALRLGVHPL